MSKVIVNTTLPTVVSEIDQVLEMYPSHPHQQVFANPDNRQKLVAYVLTRVHNHYAVVDEENYCDRASNSDAELASVYADPWLYVEAIVRQGIDEMLQQQEMSNCQLPEAEYTGMIASHWFG
ncbi:hypothetical protein [Myxacorys almedinensis]|uniref:Uncharacterized protein n=1 Tax=Myxacorys almedinensis A TaxID=2690445 RepID=A0A8J8CI49_9CYAN|nr:hypothetical protein [Myxacorys almedinensis]NDJ16116.1 hypothetical protein [Myxacorys almedinensis A]